MSLCSSKVSASNSLDNSNSSNLFSWSSSNFSFLLSSSCFANSSFLACNRSFKEVSNSSVNKPANFASSNNFLLCSFIFVNSNSLASSSLLACASRILSFNFANSSAAFFSSSSCFFLLFFLSSVFFLSIDNKLISILPPLSLVACISFSSSFIFSS